MSDPGSWDHRQDIPQSVRAFVLERDNEQCQLCGTGGENRLGLHHLIYRSHGGAHTPENLVVLCLRCHEDVHAGRKDILLLEIEPGVWATFPNVPLKNWRARL